jgi:benzoate 4-monooxygenase
MLFISSSCAITYYLAQHPAAQQKLQKELDDAIGLDDSTIVTYDQVKALPYLDACINEALRLHSTSSLGLPRLVPEGGLDVLGRHYTEGTVLSVPSYTIHREEKTWGPDYASYRPERWLERDIAVLNKAFNPFSFGPR